MATAERIGRFRVCDRMVRIDGKYQQMAAEDINRMIAEGLEASATFTPGAGDVDAGMALIEAEKREMERFKAASAKRWGRGEESSNETATQDKRMTAMDRFKASSARRHGTRQ